MDMLFVPFLLIVAYRWTDIGRGGVLGTGGITRAICLGLAASISQFPWFVGPFIFLGLWQLRAPEVGTRRAAILTARFAALAGGTALFVNAPFIVWAPRAWLKGVATPLVQHAIPFGQGIVATSVFFHIGGGNLAYYSDAAVATLAGLLVIYFVWFQRLWRAAFVLPSIVLWFATRSLTEYFVTVIAVWTVSFVVPGSGPTPSGTRVATPRANARSYFGSKHHPDRLASRVAMSAMVLAVFAPSVAFVTLALTTPPPLALRIDSVSTNGQFDRVWQIRVAVTNESGTTVEPHFTAHSTSQLTPFWDIRKGPLRLRSGQTASYTLVAPNVGSMPLITQPFLLQAVTARPATISSSSLYTPEYFDCYITPSYVNQPVPLGRTLILHVQLRSPYGAQLHERGVSVALGQIIYAQNALIPAEAQINGAPEGKTPVMSVTGADGVAVFRVRDANVQGGNPLYFQAYVAPRRGFPYGYSEIVSILWGSSSGRNAASASDQQLR